MRGFTNTATATPRHTWSGRWAVLALALGLSCAGVALVHDPGLSIATARLTVGGLTIRLAMARSDLGRLVTLDANHDGRVTDAEIQAALAQLQRQAQGAFAVNCGGQPLSPANATVARDNRDGVQFELTFHGVTAGQLSIRSAWLEQLPKGHRQFLSVPDGWSTHLRLWADPRLRIRFGASRPWPWCQRQQHRRPTALVQSRRRTGPVGHRRAGSASDLEIYFDGHVQSLRWTKARLDQFPNHVLRWPLPNPPR